MEILPHEGTGHLLGSHTSLKGQRSGLQEVRHGTLISPDLACYLLIPERPRGEEEMQVTAERMV